MILVPVGQWREVGPIFACVELGTLAVPCPELWGHALGWRGQAGVFVLRDALSPPRLKQPLLEPGRRFPWLLEAAWIQRAAHPLLPSCSDPPLRGSQSPAWQQKPQGPQSWQGTGWTRRLRCPRDASGSSGSRGSLAAAPHICMAEQLGRGERQARLANELGLFSFFAFAEPGWRPSRTPEDQEICESHSCLRAE